MAAPAAQLRALARRAQERQRAGRVLPDRRGRCRRSRTGCAVEAIVADSEDEVLGVNDKLQLAEVEAVNRRRRAQELMAQGVTLVDPARFDVRGAGRRSAATSTSTSTWSSKARSSSVTACASAPTSCCATARSARTPRSSRTASSYDAVVGAALQVGPFARFRPGAVLAGRGAHRQLRRGEEARDRRRQQGEPPDLLGDATVGQKVNVGAGTITLQLRRREQVAAPRSATAPSSARARCWLRRSRSARSATIGAGSTITKDAPAGKLTLERGKQVTIEGWKRPEKK